MADALIEDGSGFAFHLFQELIRVVQQANEGAPPRPRQLTEASLKADRLRGFRAKDPSLDTAADALDLEIVDEV